MNRPVPKCCVVGDSGAGKKCFVARTMRDSFPPRPSPLCEDFYAREIVVPGFGTQRVILWEPCGAERFRPLTRSFYRGALVIFVLFDASRGFDAERCSKWFDEGRQYFSSLVLIGSKADLGVDPATTAAAMAFADGHGVKYYEVSSKTDSGAATALSDSVAAALARAPDTLAIFPRSGAVRLPSIGEDLPVVHARACTC